MSKTTIPRGGITADAIDATLIADDAISDEHLDATAITGHTALAEAPAGTDEFLISDGGVLKRLDASHVGSAYAPDNVQVFATSANQTIGSNSQTTITTYGDGQITGRLLYNYGTQYVTHSSGIFSFSTEGYYHVALRVSGTITASGGTATGHVYLDSTTNNSSYADAIDVNLSVATATGGFNSYYDGVFKITDTSNHKLRSSIYLPQGGEVGGGSGSRRRTYISFIRLGTAS